MYKSKKQILVVDDEGNITDVVKSYLENDGFIVHTAHNGKDAINLFDKVGPSLIILDLMLPDIPGEQVCSIVRTKSRVPIIMLTAKTKEDDMLNGLEIGADDYVTKPFSPRQLVARVKANIRRTDDDPVPLSRIISFNEGDLVINDLNYEIRKKDNIIDLTPIEYDVLITLVKYPSKIFTREELVSIVLGGNPEVSDRTIDSHIKNLRRKIEDNPKAPRYISTVHGIGYKFGV
ncbi:MAG: response regulator transcription factor [Bacillota bacterium]|nr:response regulator transcription factor [Bacillota bacterium]